jgi:hypothetical protein
LVTTGTRNGNASSLLTSRFADGESGEGHRETGRRERDIETGLGGVGEKKEEREEREERERNQNQQESACVGERETEIERDGETERERGGERVRREGG